MIFISHLDILPTVMTFHLLIWTSISNFDFHFIIFIRFIIMYHNLLYEAEETMKLVDLQRLGGDREVEVEVELVIGRWYAVDVSVSLCYYWLEITRWKKNILIHVNWCVDWSPDIDSWKYWVSMCERRDNRMETETKGPGMQRVDFLTELFGRVLYDCIMFHAKDQIWKIFKLKPIPEI